MLLVLCRLLLPFVYGSIDVYKSHQVKVRLQTFRDKKVGYMWSSHTKQYYIILLL
jgi:hypothetical protein